MEIQHSHVTQVIMSITNRADAVTAIGELLDDLKRNVGSWENPTLEHYLEAIQAWLEDSARDQDEPPSWDLVVRMLKAAKIYE